MAKKDKDSVVETAKLVAGAAGRAGAKAADKVKKTATKTNAAVIEAIDENGNGDIDIEDIIIKGLKTPGVRINRTDFLKKELFKNYTQATIKDAVVFNPAHAGIPLEEVDKIADEVIKYERNCVSGISAALGAPGGAAMIATIPADIMQYYGYMLRTMQKLMYLYGFPEIELNTDGQVLDSEIMNALII